MVKIFLDPGHGGSDPGAVGNGIQEKDITLAIATRIKNLLAKYNVEVKMSRTSDTFPSLSDRTNAANAWGATFFMSVHVNSGGGTGFETFVYPGSGAPTTTYQNLIHAEIMKLLDFNDRGKKQSNLHVLRESNMPAILTENGFIDNATDAAKLKNGAYLDKIAQGHVNGLVKAFGLTLKNIAVSEEEAADNKLYRVTTGTFKDVDSQKQAIKNLLTLFKNAYPYDTNGLRAITGTFVGKASAETAAAKIKAKFGYLTYIKAE
ncbi:N-acetylmuramoyl-L-alanine amidase family protein [Bacillus testis]|uniref:N-acetylmuramoyl-L-alanine amidase family protein n=1 Tax=Bacillus testis TaxID=1622072 RepID=UPI00067EC144|nr:N-acetylmuramoyl-L-alanine amidase [Bacillus testis]